MSSKKEDKKNSKKYREDMKEKERMEQEEAKREKERQEAEQRVHVLENSGILDAYEYFLRAICKNGLPETNIFEFAAQQVLKYQRKMKQQEGKREELQNYNRSIMDQKAIRIEKSPQREEKAEELPKSAKKRK